MSDRRFTIGFDRPESPTERMIQKSLEVLARNLHSGLSADFVLVVVVQNDNILSSTIHTEPSPDPKHFADFLREIADHHEGKPNGFESK